MKQIIQYIFIGLFFSFELFSQTNLNNPINQTNNAYYNLISDFGPRIVGGTSSKYHGGIDYRVALTGAPAYCIENGNISFGAMAQTYAYVRVGPWRYMHVNTTNFQDSNGDIIWEIIVDQGQYLILIRERINGVLTLIHVYASNAYLPTTYSGVPVETTANVGDLIFRARDYGVPGNAGDHLHLDKGTLTNSGWDNPLNYLARQDNLAPTVTSMDIKYDNNGVATLFNGNVIYNDVILESYINTADEYDLSSITYQLIHNKHTSNLFTWTLSGTNHIQVDVISTGYSAIPQYNIRQIWCTGTSITPITNSTLEGIFPVSQYSEGVAGHDIFKYIFNSNQVDITSSNPLNYVYPDGKYAFRVVAQDLGNNSATYTTPNILIDNLMPYIIKLEISNILGNPFYTGEWISDGTNLNYQLTESDDYMNIAYPTTIKFWVSEPLDESTLNLPTIEINGSQANYSKNIDGKYWEYTLPANFLMQASSIYDISISGYDLNHNPVIDMPDVAGTIALSSMPVRNGATFDNIQNFFADETLQIGSCLPTNATTQSTSPTGTTETTYSYCQQPSGSLAFPKAEFSYSASSTNPNVISFTNTSQYSEYYSWDFGDGIVLNTENPGSYTFPSEPNNQTYEVTLTASNIDGESDLYTKSIFVQGYNEPVSNDINLTGHWLKLPEPDQVIPPRERYQFFFDLTPNSLNTYEFMLDFGDGEISKGTSSNLNAFKVYEPAYTIKTYYPTLFVYEYNNGALVNSYSYNYTPITNIPWEEKDISINFPVEGCQSINNYEKVLPGQNFKLGVEAFNGLGRHTLVWEFYDNITGSGEPIEVIAHYLFPESTNLCRTSGAGALRVNDFIEFKYDEVGEYMIKLRVNDQYGHFGYSEYLINISENTGCANFSINIPGCVTQYNIPLGKGVKFGINYNGNIFSDCNTDNTFPGKIEWEADNRIDKGSECLQGYKGSPTEPQRTKCIKFDTPGKHTISATIFPWKFNYFPDPISARYGVILNQGRDYTSKTIKTINVIDCENTIDINSYSELLSLSPPIDAGYINICSSSGSSLSIPANENHSLLARNYIVLKPGFHAQLGSIFSAKVEPCPEVECSDCIVDKSTDCEFTHIAPPSSKVTISKTQVFDDVGNGGANITFNVAEDFGGPYYGGLRVVFEDDEVMDTEYRYENEAWIWRYYGLAIRTKVHIELNIYNQVYTTPSFHIGGFGLFYKSDTSEIFETFPVEKVYEKFDFNIYPNPASEYFMIDIENHESEVEKIEVYNHIGQLIYFKGETIEPQNIINTSKWPTGVYIVRLISTKANVETKKLIIE